MLHNYEKLNIYQAGLKLAQDIYLTYRDLPCYAIRDQILKSVISIPSNIAEGSQRGSIKEFLKFIYYSKGSATELLTQLRILEIDNNIDPLKLEELINSTHVLNRQIQAFINHLRS